ncbi:hypothetical protein BXZ70DRAFT_908047 [Cristinia sonorae]|uniref:Uncharacterized protein n=1 Tax=Cristinia sonorae TaxID=1940300 RepID=A0A8K0ULZ5_9AGAR|nr:hypothetical protein BXZ70DRAFT_908047 [Cristinia sonorae]
MYNISGPRALSVSPAGKFVFSGPGKHELSAHRSPAFSGSLNSDISSKKFRIAGGVCSAVDSPYSNHHRQVMPRAKKIKQARPSRTIINKNKETGYIGCLRIGHKGLHVRCLRDFDQLYSLKYILAHISIPNIQILLWKLTLLEASIDAAKPGVYSSCLALSTTADSWPIDTGSSQGFSEADSPPHFGHRVSLRLQTKNRSQCQHDPPYTFQATPRHKRQELNELVDLLSGCREHIWVLKFVKKVFCYTIVEFNSGSWREEPNNNEYTSPKRRGKPQVLDQSSHITMNMKTAYLLIRPTLMLVIGFLLPNRLDCASPQYFSGGHKFPPNSPGHRSGIFGHRSHPSLLRP